MNTCSLGSPTDNTDESFRDSSSFRDWCDCRESCEPHRHCSFGVECSHDGRNEHAHCPQAPDWPRILDAATATGLAAQD